MTRLPDGSTTRVRCEVLSPSERRWLVTGPDGLAHVGPEYVANESTEVTVPRIRHWWTVRAGAGQWGRERRP
jgi:hypothetical protein